MPASELPITIEDIRAAALRLQGKAVMTPLLNSPELGERLSATVLLKAENLQRTGSFKFRGAFNCLACADPQQRARGVVAWSSGNHAQGVAAAARLFGVPATIVMPEDAPEAKIAGTRSYGADIVFYDRYSGDREALGRELAAKRGALLVPSYDHRDVIAGQGTTGLEIAAQCRARGATPDRVLICCGGGGLSAGTSIGIHSVFPEARIHTVEPEFFDDTRRSLECGMRLRNAPQCRSVCDALLTETPGALTFPILCRDVASGLSVSDDEALAAVFVACIRLKLTLEPGGAVALAALLSGRIDVRGETVVVVLSGGNIDPALLARILRENSC